MYSTHAQSVHIHCKVADPKRVRDHSDYACTRSSDRRLRHESKCHAQGSYQKTDHGAPMTKTTLGFGVHIFGHKETRKITRTVGRASYGLHVKQEETKWRR